MLNRIFKGEQYYTKDIYYTNEMLLLNYLVHPFMVVVSSE